MVEVPPEHPPAGLRAFFEQAGYTVRHKLSRAELAACGQSTQVQWVTVQAEAMEKLYRRHRDMLLASSKMLNLARSWLDTLHTLASEVAIYWWHDEDGCELLSDSSVMGLRTAVHIAGLQPVLYGYKKPLNLPGGVEYKDAAEVLTLEEFTEHRKYYPPAVVADLARLRGMKKAVDVGATYVWFVDLDTLWCKDVKAACSLLPAAAFEHVVGTWQGRCVSRGGVVTSIHKGMCEFLRAPFDFQYAATPIRITRRSPLLFPLLQGLETTMSARCGADDYLIFMKILKQTVFECGLLGAYQLPVAFCGVHYWTKRSCLTKPFISTSGKGSKNTVCADDILKDAIGINTFWQSGWHAEQTLFDRGSDAHVGSGSLWACLLQKLNATMASACSHVDPSCGQDMPACSHDGHPAARRRKRRKGRDPCAAVQNPLPWSQVEIPPDSHLAGFRNGRAATSSLMDWEHNDIKRRCTLIKRLGEGTYGNVYVAKYIGDADLVAVKISKASHLHRPIAPTEIALLNRLRGHENVVRLRDFFFSPYFTVLVLQKMDADLWHVLHRLSDSGGLQPALATRIMGLVACGAAHVHSNDIIHRDMHAGNILLSFKGGLQPTTHGLQPDFVHRVCIADFGQGCDVHGDKRFEERSVGVGARTITPPECFFAMEGITKKRTVYDSAVDVWAIGVNAFMMIAGYQKMVSFDRSVDYLKFWATVIGKVPTSVAKRMGWALEGWALQDDTQPFPRVRRVAAVSRSATPMSSDEESMCSVPLNVLMYDHTQRPQALDIHRLCEDLTRAFNASESGKELTARSNS